ncbi:hypothetical protein CTAYLR_007840 [Chrysophaeum taylorii]|uniref:NADPH-dependent FMN reductase-like domain-containing protein n=1 Tax=Chrysophaeum taylorii TaxID=2483200 RepID=A0AAD7XIX8_9STRA|nr:hypothetical protein CTAYLR_007840 [Chrysophaeum taylorii]
MRCGQVLKVAAMGSTLRSASVNQGLIRAASGLGAKYELEIVAIDLNLPLFNADLEKEVPASVLEMHKILDEADAVLFAVAEYNYSISSVLKNAIDWASRTYLEGRKSHPLFSKPAALMGAGGGMGTSRAQYHLRQVCVFLDMHLLNKPELFVQRWTGAGERFDELGNLTDETTLAKLDTMLDAFAQWIRLLKAGTEARDKARCSVECEKTVN